MITTTPQQSDLNVRVSRIGRFYCSADWSWRSSGVSDWSTLRVEQAVRWNYDLWTVLQGEGVLSIDGSSYPLSCGDCFILQQNQELIGSTDPTNPLVVVAVHFDFIDAAGQITFPTDLRLHRHIVNMAFFTQLLEHMEAAWFESEGQSPEADTWLAACLLEMNRQDRHRIWHGYRQSQAQKIELICNDIRRTPQAEWLVDELAKQLHCSRHHFSRIFKSYKGLSPKAYVTKARIEAAKALLHASDYSIERIAQESGFSSVYYFSRYFKQSTGHSPSAYRDRFRE